MSDPTKPRDDRNVPQMHKRSQHHDYHGRGIYLITLCTEDRLPLLGILTGATPAEAAITPTPLGREVLHCWEQIPVIQRRLAEQRAAKTGQPCDRDITLINWQLMPDHFHGILFVRKDMDIALGDVIRGFMIGCTKAFNGVSPLPSPSASSSSSPQVCGAQDRAAASSLPPATSAPGVVSSAYSRGPVLPFAPSGKKATTTVSSSTRASYRT